MLRWDEYVFEVHTQQVRCVDFFLFWTPPCFWAAPEVQTDDKSDLVLSQGQRFNKKDDIQASTVNFNLRGINFFCLLIVSWSLCSFVWPLRLDSYWPCLRYRVVLQNPTGHWQTLVCCLCYGSLSGHPHCLPQRRENKRGWNLSWSWSWSYLLVGIRENPFFFTLEVFTTIIIITYRMVHPDNIISLCFYRLGLELQWKTLKE